MCYTWQNSPGSTLTSTLLLKHADLLVTMDADHRRMPDGGLFVHDDVILPGLVNTHHHLYQTLTRAVPAAQDGHLLTVDMGPVIERHNRIARKSVR